MFRRRFLVAGAGALATAPGLAMAGTPASAGDRALLSKIYVTSVEPDSVANLEVGHPLILARDPGRRFEPATAVAVFAGDVRLGYLPGTVAKVVAPLLDTDVIAVSAAVTGVRGSEERPSVDIDVFVAPA